MFYHPSRSLSSSSLGAVASNSFYLYIARPLQAALNVIRVIAMVVAMVMIRMVNPNPSNNMNGFHCRCIVYGMAEGGGVV